MKLFLISNSNSSHKNAKVLETQKANAKVLETQKANAKVKPEKHENCSSSRWSTSQAVTSAAIS
jgi:hypothetical protein